MGTPTRSPPPPAPQVRYVVVFGFPPEHAAQTATMFAASADTTPPEHEGGNWFRIGYRNYWDYERALRRNGEIVNGSFMIGVIPVVSTYFLSRSPVLTDPAHHRRLTLTYTPLAHLAASSDTRPARQGR